MNPINENGVLEIGGLPVTQITQEFKTPIYVYDQSKIEEKLGLFKKYFKSDKFKTECIYASKAFNCIAMIQLCKKFGFGLDVVSYGELYTAIKAGFNMNKVYFHGNNKSKEEMELALESGVGCIILDNEKEASDFVALASQFPQQKINAMLRVNPGVEAHTHKYIQTAYVDSKFGISILKMDEIKNIVKTVEESENVNFIGFHSHIGSQIFEKKAFVAEIETLCKFISEFEKETGYPIQSLDLGGGFAAVYTSADAPIPVDEVCRTIVDTCTSEFEKYHLNIEEVMIEPGRSIAAEAGYQLYTIGNGKKTQNKEYIFIDGGMADNIRPALYQADYAMDVATKMNLDKTEVVTVAGKCCESGDILAEDIKLQPSEKGDILAVYTTGAYGYSMSSNYNKLLTPGVVFVKDKKAFWAIKPMTYDELIARECEMPYED